MENLFNFLLSLSLSLCPLPSSSQTKTAEISRKFHETAWTLEIKRHASGNGTCCFTGQTVGGFVLSFSSQTCKQSAAGTWGTSGRGIRDNASLYPGVTKTARRSNQSVETRCPLIPSVDIDIIATVSLAIYREFDARYLAISGLSTYSAGRQRKRQPRFHVRIDYRCSNYLRVKITIRRDLRSPN